VLIYVLWIVGLLGLFAAGVGSQGLFALNLADRMTEQLRAAHVARAAVPYAWAVLNNDETSGSDTLSERWAHDAARFLDRSVPGGTFTLEAGRRERAEPLYGLVDEERFVSLNGSPVYVLQALAEHVGGLPPEDALAVAEAIADWRDPDDEQRPSGAEDFRYRSQAESYPCKNAPFEQAEELLLVRGVSPLLFRRLAPYLTVHGSGRINLHTAGREILKTLGLSTEGLAGLLTFRVGEDGEPYTADDRRLASLEGLSAELEPYVPAQDLARLQRLAEDAAIGIGSSHFRLTIRASTGAAGGETRVVCVLDRDGRLLGWSES
jgi:general secretion pathway protein K